MSKVYLVTGAGSEIGLTLISSLLEAGGKIIACDRLENREKMNKYFSAIKDSLIKTYFIDLNNDNEVNTFWNEIEEKGIKIYSLINIAGINILTDFFSWERNELNKVFELNFTSTVLFTKRAAQHMILNSIKGNIIFISSQNGNVVSKYRVPYCTSKAMLIQMTKALALELSDFNIRVNCLSPTYVLTKDNEKLLNNPYFITNELSKIPVGRYAIPEDIVKSILFLTSSDSEMINGHNLIIDGGWTLP